MTPEDEWPEEYISTNDAANLMIMKAINEHLFLEKIRHLAPLIAQELIKAGVRFSHE